MTFFAQVAVDYGPLVAQFGFGGATLWVLVKWMESITKWMERIDHTMRGLSKAMWMDLASRDGAEAFVKEHARKMVEKMDADSNKP